MRKCCLITAIFQQLDDSLTRFYNEPDESKNLFQRSNVQNENNY